VLLSAGKRKTAAKYCNTVFYICSFGKIHISPAWWPKKNREFDNFLYGYETGTAPGGIYSKV
jgi:hypothetical protein